MTDRLSTIYKQIASGNGKQYEFLFSLEGLFLSVMQFDPVTDEPLPVTVDEVLYGLSSADFHKDRLQHIVDFVSSAVYNLIGILHEKNLREHRISRPEQVREIDSKSMMWLAKKPGFTVKQKIASDQRMMGVYHTTSMDTAENRLFKAFMEKLDELLLEKENARKQRGVKISFDEERFTATVHHWLKSDESSFIGRWNNTPPNNTLLNDRNYRKIWKAHLMLQNLNEQIQNDLVHLNILKIQALFWLTAARLNLSNDIRIRQNLLFPDYQKLSLAQDAALLGFARTDSWEKFAISANTDAITLGFYGQEAQYTLPENIENFSEIISRAEQICVDFLPNYKLKSVIHNQTKCDKKHSVAAVDLSSVLASFTLGDNTKGRFSKKLIHQSVYLERDKKSAWYPCSSSMSKLVDTKSKNIKTFSVHSVFDETIRSQIDSNEDKNIIEKTCADFAKIVKEELCCQKCLYITNDDLDDFSPTVNAFKRSMNSTFSKTEILPRSIAALFSNFIEIRNRVHEKDEILIRTFFGDYEIVTKIRIKIDKELAKKNPETNGISFQRLEFERHELENRPLENCVPQNLNRILTLSDANILQGKFSSDDFHFEEKSALKKNLSKNGGIFIYEDDDTSTGAIMYERLQQITPEIPLWCDFLPKLSMVDSSGKEYVLVEPKKVSIRPIVGKPVRIPISWQFSFPPQKKFYEFPLFQGDKK